MGRSCMSHPWGIQGPNTQPKSCWFRHIVPKIQLYHIVVRPSPSEPTSDHTTAEALHITGFVVVPRNASIWPEHKLLIEKHRRLPELCLHGKLREQGKGLGCHRWQERLSTMLRGVMDIWILECKRHGASLGFVCPRTSWFSLSDSTDLVLHCLPNSAHVIGSKTLISAEWLWVLHISRVLWFSHL